MLDVSFAGFLDVVRKKRYIIYKLCDTLINFQKRVAGRMLAHFVGGRVRENIKTRSQTTCNKSKTWSDII